MNTIRLQVAAWRNGRMLLDQRLCRVRIDDQPWRDAKTADFDTALRWLMDNNFSFDAKRDDAPVSVGSVRVTYVYRSAQGAEQEAITQ